MYGTHVYRTVDGIIALACPLPFPAKLLGPSAVVVPFLVACNVLLGAAAVVSAFLVACHVLLGAAAVVGAVLFACDVLLGAAAVVGAFLAALLLDLALGITKDIVLVRHLIFDILDFCCVARHLVQVFLCVLVLDEATGRKILRPGPPVVSPPIPRYRHLASAAGV